jgi:hypothetical protein
MASKIVSDAIYARLENTANWNHPEIPIVKGNIDPGTENARFLAVQFPIANEDVASLGDPSNRLFREEGVVRLVLHGRSGEGADELLVLLEELRVLFRAKEFSGVITYAPTPAVEHDDNDDGNYYAVSTAVPYEFDLTA